MRSILPAFDEAVIQFQSFLGNEGYSRQIVWITPCDILLTGKPMVYLRVSEPGQNLSVVQREYELGTAANLGVKLSSFCDFGKFSYCFVWHPRDKDEAQRALMPADGGLKLSVTNGSSRPIARRVSNRILWWLLKFKYRRENAPPQRALLDFGLP